jgi:hypothetical protein
MTTDPLEPKVSPKELDLVPVETDLLASMVGIPGDQLPEPVFDSDEEVGEFIRWVRATRNEGIG